MIADFFTSKKANEIARLAALDAAKTQEIIEKDKLIAELSAREDNLLSIKSAMEVSSAAIMTINRDFIVTYVNAASMALFNSNRDELKKVFPSFDPSKIVGTCIDVFHQNPQHQRQMLATPARLPFSTEIKVGPLTIALYVTAIYDAKGAYAGNVLEWRDVTEIKKREIQDFDSTSQKLAIDRFQGAIEMDLDGNILFANETYLKIVGYSANELVGKHVGVVLDPNYAKSAEYAALWARLIKGEYISGQYKRIAKGGREVWIHAYYSPIHDMSGKQVKVVNYVIDITEQKLKSANDAGQIAAINKIQGVIEFDLKGNILSVNENFANLVGYSYKEIVGKHHSMFVEPSHKESQEYKDFWHNLEHGEATASQFRRIGKAGKIIWLQAFYAPILDMNGKPYKVVKFATDITEQHDNSTALADAVEETQSIIEGAKAGDLSSRVPLAGKTGAIASLCDGVNALMDKMTEVIIQVKEAGETINTAAGEISSGNTDLSSRTEQQASSLEETASSMEELASTVKQNAENAKQANHLAATASGVAVKGGEVVGQVVNTMSAINSSAKKIEDIISVIDGIAFQTNILALNAAVEAARAGEQGRGFAVVAGEVRNLAQRSASAAKEIKELITDSVSKTAEGTKQVEHAGQTMQEIVTSVQRVTDIMGEITAASVEQSAGIDQVNDAITSMDEVTQQNAALVEQAAAAAESLVDQAVGLMDTVSAFKLNGGGTYAATQPAARALARRPISSSAARSARPSVAKPVARPVSAKSSMSANSDDGDWEEF